MNGEAVLLEGACNQYSESRVVLDHEDSWGSHGWFMGFKLDEARI